MDLLLIEQLLQYICGVGQYARQEEDTSVVKGAVLVFLPVRSVRGTVAGAPIRRPPVN